MPAAKYSLDFDNGKLSDSKGTLIQSLSVKNESVRDFELAITQNGVAMSLAGGATVKVALKKMSAAAGVLLFEDDAIRSGWGSGSRWFFRIDLTAPAFDPIVGTTVDFEILISLPDGQRIRSVTFPFVIAKNVMS